MQEYLVESIYPGQLELVAEDNKNKTPRDFHHINDLIAFQSIDSGTTPSLLGAGHVKIEDNDHASPVKQTLPKDTGDVNGTLYPEVTGCRSLWETVQSVWDEDTFKQLQDTYRLIVDEDNWSIATFPNSGLVVPYEVRDSPGKGRGVFATSRIPKGSLIWYPVQHAIFPDESTFRRFLSSLTWGLACDILQWAYVEEISKEEHKVAVELDQGSFLNHASGDEANIGELRNGANVIAIRDIEAGEEIVHDYTTYDNDDAIQWFDDMVDLAFGDDRVKGQ